MSLYAFGKLRTLSSEAIIEAELERIGMLCNVVLRSNGLDVEDVAAIESFGQFHGGGIYYWLGSSSDPTEATELWIEAMVAVRASLGDNDNVVREILAGRQSAPEAAVSSFGQTRLGMCCLSLMKLTSGGGSVALVDGGIESSFVGEQADCVGRLCVDVIRPWDQCPNRLYIWPGAGRS
jgi:hypothetical protein